MKEFFRVTELQKVLSLAEKFARVATEKIPLISAYGRILAEDIVSDINLPDFTRSTMDGYAIAAASSFGASETNPAYAELKETIPMGVAPDFSIKRGEAARISTGGMLPAGADSVVMIEHTTEIDDKTLEIYRSVAPGQHIVKSGEDFNKGEAVLSSGRKIRPQEAGLLAAFGLSTVAVYQKPKVGIISTGDEILPIDEFPGPGQMRDINTYSLSSLVLQAGGIPQPYDIVKDDYDALYATCKEATEQADMLIISGGSSVGVRDFSIDVLASLPDSEILTHGITISPGKPTILSKSGGKAIWGLPGHVVSAMIVFTKVVRPFIDHISGLSEVTGQPYRLKALLGRSISSAPGRVDFVRVSLEEKDGDLWAHPVLGKSGLINTMVKADGLIEIGMNREGLDKETAVAVQLI